MEIEYSNEVKGRVHAYRFTHNEKAAIAESLKPAVKKLEAKIERIRNHPKNEGQATYACQIDDLKREINQLQGIIDEFSK